MWNRNQRLSIILPILYSAVLVSSFIIMVRFTKSNTCEQNLHPHSLWTIYFMVVGALHPSTGMGCFVRYGGQDLVFLWALLMLWDAGKHKCVIPFPSSN